MAGLGLGRYSNKRSLRLGLANAGMGGACVERRCLTSRRWSCRGERMGMRADASGAGAAITDEWDRGDNVMALGRGVQLG